MVADLLTLARLDADEVSVGREPVDVSELLAQAALAWGPRCEGAGVVLRVETGGPSAPALADPGRLR